MQTDNIEYSKRLFVNICEYTLCVCVCVYSAISFLNGKPMVFLTCAFGNETWKIFYLVNPGDFRMRKKRKLERKDNMKLEGNPT